MTDWKIGEDQRKNKGAFYEIRDLLYRMFPEAVEIKPFYWGSPVRVACGTLYNSGNNYSLRDKEGKDSNIFLTKMYEGVCTCGGAYKIKEEVWTPGKDAAWLEELKLGRGFWKGLIRWPKERIGLAWTEMDAKTQDGNRIILKECERGHNKRFYKIVPGALDEWLRQQFRPRE